jgi:hypothetical protein
MYQLAGTPPLLLMCARLWAATRLTPARLVLQAYCAGLVSLQWSQMQLERKTVLQIELHAMEGESGFFPGRIWRWQQRRRSSLQELVRSPDSGRLAWEGGP